MYDLDLGMRFFKGMTDAMIHGANASFAATQELQASLRNGEMLRGAQPAFPTSAPTNAAIMGWMWPVSMWMPGAVGPQTPNFFKNTKYANASGAPSQTFASLPGQSIDWWQNQSPAWMMEAQKTSLQTASQVFWSWPAVPWQMYQMPFTASLLSVGMPASVAAPTAQATLSALDAADAARLQLIEMMQSYQRGQGSPRRKS